MKVKICAISSWYDEKQIIIEVNSIDEAIKRIQEDKTLVMSIITRRSWLYNEKDRSYSIPNNFIINTNKTEEYDVEIELYDGCIE